MFGMIGRDGVMTRWNSAYASAILFSKGGVKVEALDVYTSILVVISAALLLAAAGLAKKQLVWKRPAPVRVRRRKRRP